jgi:hypothetical protein
LGLHLGEQQGYHAIPGSVNKSKGWDLATSTKSLATGSTTRSTREREERDLRGATRSTSGRGSHRGRAVPSRSGARGGRGGTTRCRCRSPIRGGRPPCTESNRPVAVSLSLARWRAGGCGLLPGPDRGARSNPTTGGLSLRLADRYQGVTQGRPAKRRGCVVTTPLTPGNFISGREKGHGVPTRWSSSGSPRPERAGRAVGLTGLGCGWLSSETARGPQAAATTSSDVGDVAAENDLWAACGV